MDNYLKIQGEIIFIEMFVFKANWKANIGSSCLKPRRISGAIAVRFEVINLAYIYSFF